MLWLTKINLEISKVNDMKLIRIASFMLIITFSGCKYSLFVQKDRVINIRSGYLMFYRDQQIFFPVRKVKEGNELSQIENVIGYAVYFEKESQAYREISKKIPITHNYKYESEVISRADTIGIMAVEIRSLSYKNKGKKELNELTVQYNQLPRIFKYYNTNNEGVWSVYPIFKSDLQQLDKYYN